MAAMLDHSNARPAGVSIQADKTSDYGEYVTTVLVSVRNDEFGAMSDQLVDIFQSDCVDTCGEAAHFMTSGDDAGQVQDRQTVARVTVRGTPMTIRPTAMATFSSVLTSAKPTTTISLRHRSCPHCLCVDRR